MAPLPLNHGLEPRPKGITEVDDAALRAHLKGNTHSFKGWKAQTFIYILTWDMYSLVEGRILVDHPVLQLNDLKLFNTEQYIFPLSRPF